MSLAVKFRRGREQRKHGVSDYTSFRNQSEKSGDRGRALWEAVARCHITWASTKPSVPNPWARRNSDSSGVSEEFSPSEHFAREDGDEDFPTEMASTQREERSARNGRGTKFSNMGARDAGRKKVRERVPRNGIFPDTSGRNNGWRSPCRHPNVDGGGGGGAGRRTTPLYSKPRAEWGARKPQWPQQLSKTSLLMGRHNIPYAA
ncbi:hypothetical protein FOMPIDRAFT_1016110 [Fomitopsis schrenkii]|uniref:Uncharacterized protein n=1 Tax=Fomitopsis schrenkii TaxID=2126942 RepID=S8E901_FOMSC|nr:hypothetical protein FOMPIDRAFT_1016110 [Fomitopsis schrenkii]